MKHIKTIYKAFIILIFISACTEDENLDFLENIAPPTNVEAIFKITPGSRLLAITAPNILLHKKAPVRPTAVSYTHLTLPTTPYV